MAVKVIVKLNSNLAKLNINQLTDDVADERLKDGNKYYLKQNML